MKKHHVIVLTIDLERIAKMPLIIMEYASMFFVWLYYSIGSLVDLVVFYSPDVWRAVKRYALMLAQCSKIVLKRSKGVLLYFCETMIFSSVIITLLTIKAYKSFAAWFSDAWAFRAEILAEC